MNATEKTVRLGDLIDIDRVRSLLQALHETNGNPLALMDRDNNMLVALGFQDICAKFHRAHPGTEAKCVEASAQINARMFDGPFTMYECPNGIYDIAFPIVIDGHFVGTFWTGQLFLAPPDLSAFKRRAKDHNFEEAAYLEALKKVPVRTRAEAERSIAFYQNLVGFICEAGLRKLRQDRLNQELQRQVVVAQQQREIIRELSVPILEVWDDVLVMPIVGALDAERSQDAMTRLLDHIAARQSRCAIIDITGVPAINRATVDALRTIIQAASLLGVKCVLTGVQPATARVFVDTGIQLDSVNTLRDLKAGLRASMDHLAPARAG